MLPEATDPGRLPDRGELVHGATAPDLPLGGETAGRRRLDAWLDDGLARYGELADVLAADATSRLSAYLHFGCVSAGEVVARYAHWCDELQASERDGWVLVTGRRRPPAAESATPSLVPSEPGPT